MANEHYLIDHWSFSSMKDFLRNRYMFRRKWVMKIHEFKDSPSVVIGSAGHKALEVILGGGTHNEGMQAGLEYIQNKKLLSVNWTKALPTPADLVQDYSRNVTGYLSEMPKWDVVFVEKSITAFIEVDGVRLAIPAKAKTDLCVRNEHGRLDGIDHKFVSKYTEDEAEKGDYAMQAMFNYHTILAETGEKLERFIFNEYKGSKNKDGSKQLQPYVIEFDKHPEYFAMFYQLYDCCTVELSRPDCMFLPNFSDMMDGGQTFKCFMTQIMGTSAPLAIKHKTQDMTIVENNYVPSVTDVVDNAFLTDEEKIRVKFLELGIAVKMETAYRGGSVTKYTLRPSRGVKMAMFDKYAMDIAIALKAKSVRIEAPILGTDLVGIEIPNAERTFFPFGESPQGEAGSLQIPIGVDVYGQTIMRDISDMPHLLIAGATNSGKSVMINVIIQALMRQNTPEQMKLVLIDPKRVELAAYKAAPHLQGKLIYEVEQANAALKWLVEEMEYRYSMLESVGARNIAEYNQMNVPMHRIVVVIDEFADLMMQQIKGDKAEDNIVRLAQKARAIGIHIVLGTQRPSVDVVTGLIKANIPTRISFATAQRIDSQIILDQPGAEQLIGKGDMLFLDPSRRDLQRLQGFYV